MPRYTVIYTERARKSLHKVDAGETKKILLWIEKNLANCEDPRIKGKQLKGNYKNVWRYRVGTYRIIASIEELEMTIEIVTVGHRKNIYTRRGLQ